MFYFYLVTSAALIPILDNFYKILREPYSWWLVPVLFVSFFLGFVIIQLALFFVWTALVNAKTERNVLSSIYRGLVNITLPLAFKLMGVKITVTGKEKITTDKKVLLVCNHVNNVDPAVIICALPELCLGFVAKKEAYDLFPFVAKCMKKLYCLPIDRQNNREAVKTIVKAVSYIQDDKVSIGIFPEGYTSKDGNLQELRNGAFKIATKAKAPIVVCTLVNSEKILKNLFKRKTEVFLDVVEVIPETEFSDMKTDEIGKRVYDKMLESINNRKNK